MRILVGTHSTFRALFHLLFEWLAKTLFFTRRKYLFFKFSQHRPILPVPTFQSSISLTYRVISKNKIFHLFNANFSTFKKLIHNHLISCYNCLIHVLFMLRVIGKNTALARCMSFYSFTSFYPALYDMIYHIISLCHGIFVLSKNQRFLLSKSNQLLE